ncbi:Origin recognition complex subunit 2 [Rhizoclosmatium sp. JEL0117]|nr:Origin recognition complex subunit 2 [Rhizoclosmatium sp. JEL0117]
MLGNTNIKVQLQKSFFAGLGGGEAAVDAAAAAVGAPASARKAFASGLTSTGATPSSMSTATATTTTTLAPGTPGTRTPSSKPVDDQFAFAVDDRSRAAAAAAASMSSSTLKSPAASKVFALAAEQAKHAKRTRLLRLDAVSASDVSESDADAQRPPLASNLNTPTKLRQRSANDTPRSKAVIFAENLEAQPTPSRNIPTAASTPLKRSLRQSATATPQQKSKQQLSSSNDATPDRRVTRSAVKQHVPEPKTPKGRTPDAKLIARQRLAETMNASDSESDQESDDDSDEEAEDEEFEPSYLAAIKEREAAEGVEPSTTDDGKDTSLTPSLFGKKDSDFDRDVKRRGKLRANVEDYFVDSRSTATSKKLTSNNTLASLPVLTRAEFLDCLTRIPRKHAKERDMLQSLIPSRFPQWNCELAQGFNLLLYGYGSKRAVLDQFKEYACKNVPVLTLNGYMPTINLATDLFAKLSVGVLGKDATKPLGNVATQLAQVAAYFKDPAREFPCMYLLINSIDGPAMRSGASNKTLLVLQTLIQSVPRGTIRVIATIDHINAPLLWDRQSADWFHWLWKDVTTYQEYFVETGHEGFVMVEAETRKGVNGAVHVLRSLNVNARRMFRILAEEQMLALSGGGDGGEEEAQEKGRKKRRGEKGSVERGDAEDEEEDEQAGKKAAAADKSVKGMSYNGFLQKCIEQFCVNSLDNFKAQLAEFRDHRIILSKRGFQGEENVYIPFDKTTLENLIGQLSF